jgi:L-gulonolactone oxidase
MKEQLNYKFTNWAKNEYSISSHFIQPTTESELIEAVKKSKSLRVVGTGHSWSAACVTSDTLLNLDNYNRILSVNRETMQVHVQAGIKLWQLNELLDKQGLALKNLGSISGQSLAGAVSTATHGSGIQFNILGSQVEEFSIIKANGTKLLIHRERDKELFDLALVNLGCLGVVSEVLLNVTTAFNLHDYTSVESFETVIENLEEYVNATDHFKLWWFPHTEDVVVYRHNRTQEPANDSRLRQWLMDEVVSVGLYRMLLKVGTINRNWRKVINRMLLQNFLKPIDRIEKSYKVFNVPEPPLHREAEWAFDLKVAKDLLRSYKRMLDSSSHRINFLQEIRFTKADNFALSPCYQRDSMWLGAYNADNFGWEELKQDFEVLAKSYKGRPHWGKEFNIDVQYLKSCYPMYNDFNNLRKSFDPESKFSNNYISKIFSF